MKYRKNEYKCVYTFFLLFLIIPLFSIANSQCSTPSSYNNNGGMNTVTFGPVDNLGVSDDIRNSVALDKKKKVDGQFQDFGFTIPVGAIIDGYEITVEGYWDNGSGCKKLEIELYDGSNKGSKYTGCGIIGDGVDVLTTFGGPTDLMDFDGMGPDPILTPVDINNNLFGIDVKFESNVNGNILNIDFIEICIYYTPGPLPVNLLYFRGNSVINGNIIEWSTSNESNNNYFTLEKLIDGIYVDIATIYGAGHSNNIIIYSYVDAEPLNGNNYYRLSQTDYDDTIETFFIISVLYIGNINGSMSIYPNPASVYDSINIKLIGYENEEILVIVQDILGELHYSKVTIIGYTKEMVIVIDPYKNLSRGTYIITGSSNNNLYHKKLVIN